MIDGVNGDGLLRVLAVSGLAGFIVFCASYSLTVWLRRNRAGVISGSGLRKLSILLVVVGGFGAAGFWLAAQFTQRKGLVDGDDLFVVHTRTDARIENLVSQGPVAEGQIIAIYRSPVIDAQLAVTKSQADEALARIEALKSRPLVIDPALLQAQGQNRVEQEQTRAFLLDLHKSKRERERDILTLFTTWTREKSQLIAELQIAEQSFKSASGQIDIGKKSLDRSKGVLPVLMLEEKSRNLLALELDKSRWQLAVTALQHRLSFLEERYEKAERSLVDQEAEINADLRAMKQRSESLAEKGQEIERLLDRDRERAFAAADSEIDAAYQQLEVLAAEKKRILGSAQVEAPFSGRVVYRHPAPGLVPENTPALAISAGSGFAARIWLPRSEVDQIARAGQVRFLLEDAVLNKYFVGEFRRAEEVPLESERVIAHFDANLPVEALTMLGKAVHSLPVKLQWRPGLLSDYYFVGSLLLIMLGVLGLIADAARRKKNLHIDYMDVPWIDDAREDSSEVIELRGSQD